MLAPEGLEAYDSPVNLEALLLRIRPLFRRGENLLHSTEASHPKHVRQLRDAIRVAQRDLVLWPNCQPQSWQPRTIGEVRRDMPEDEKNSDHLQCFFWPGPVDVYYDCK